MNTSSTKCFIIVYFSVGIYHSRHQIKIFNFSMHLCNFLPGVRGKILRVKGRLWASFDYEKGSVGPKSLGKTVLVYNLITSLLGNK